MIKQQVVGIYLWLLLGFKVLCKIENIVYDEQIKVGYILMQMLILQFVDLWCEFGWYDVYGFEMFWMKDWYDCDMLFLFMVEEMFIDVFCLNVNSYKDLLLIIYQIQWKFCDEVCLWFGVMCGCEFYMKDGYNFDLIKEDVLYVYNCYLVSYLCIYEWMGFQVILMCVDFGLIGGDDIYEFLVLVEIGEFEVFYDSQIIDLMFGDCEVDYDSVEQCQVVLEEFISCYVCIDEIYEEVLFNEVLEDCCCVVCGIEVGQIFYFGIKYLDVMGVIVVDKDGNKVFVYMGLYGIGVLCLLGVIIEVNYDDNGIIWFEGVILFYVGIVNLKQGDDQVDVVCDGFYDELIVVGFELFYDDCSECVGVKFVMMDLIGLLWCIIVGLCGLKNGVVELISCCMGESVELVFVEVVEKIKEIYVKYLYLKGV